MLLRFLHVIKSIHSYSFSLLSSIPSYGPTTFVHPPTSWWTLAAMNIYGWAFRGCAFSLLLDRFLQVELLSHGICICLTFKNPEHCLTKSLCHSASPRAVDPSSSSSHPHFSPYSQSFWSPPTQGPGSGLGFILQWQHRSDRKGLMLAARETYFCDIRWQPLSPRTLRHSLTSLSLSVPMCNWKPEQLLNMNSPWVTYMEDWG